jgi:hypothetical protein
MIVLTVFFLCMLAHAAVVRHVLRPRERPMLGAVGGETPCAFSTRYAAPILEPVQRIDLRMWEEQDRRLPPKPAFPPGRLIAEGGREQPLPRPRAEFGTTIQKRMDASSQQPIPPLQPLVRRPFG